MFASIIRISLSVFVLYSVFGTGTAVADDAAPVFKLEGHQQDMVSLDQHKGQLVYVDFWASWCQPCRKSFTWMNKMHKLYGNEGLKIIAINLDEDRDKAEQFLKKIPASFDVAFDPEGETAEAYRVQAMPSSYLVDKDGQLVYVNKGFRGNDKEQLEARIRQYIKQSTVAMN